MTRELNPEQLLNSVMEIVQDEETRNNLIKNWNEKNYLEMITILNEHGYNIDLSSLLPIFTQIQNSLNHLHSQGDDIIGDEFP
jgi:hypothetical protein